MTDYQLSSLVGKKVQIDRGGPESKSGTVLAVGNDYLMLSNPTEGIIYYYINHIKSITLSNSDSPNSLQEELPSEVHVTYDSPQTMKEILLSKKFKLIQINRGGPEKVRGVLSDVYDDYIAIVSKEEVLLLVYYHIKSCSFPVVTNTEANGQEKESNKDNKDKNNKDNKENKDNNDNKDKDNKNQSKNKSSKK